MRKVKKSLIFLWVISTILPPVLTLSDEAYSGSSTQVRFPSCRSFGVKIFQERKEAPNFSLTSLEGKLLCLNDLKGKPIVLVFWATWCETCMDELPAIEKFFSGKGEQMNALLVTIDGERKKAAQKIIREKNVTLPVLLVLKEKVMDHYGVRGWVPQIFFIDKEGFLVGKIMGPRDWSSPQAWSCIREIFDLP
ncbi:MAG: TlpA family protein disulfide reductase [Thermodesulfobacteriota bacterium]